MKNKIKFIKTFIIILILLCIVLPSNVYAIGELLASGDNFIGAGNNVEDTINTVALQNASSNIYNMFLVVGIVIAVLAGACIGIKIMVATVEEKAKIKEALVPYVVGCIVLFSAFTIWGVVINIGNKINPEPENNNNDEIIIDQPGHEDYLSGLGYNIWYYAEKPSFDEYKKYCENSDYGAWNEFENFEVAWRMFVNYINDEDIYQYQEKLEKLLGQGYTDDEKEIIKQGFEEGKIQMLEAFYNMGHEISTLCNSTTNPIINSIIVRRESFSATYDIHFISKFNSSEEFMKRFWGCFRNSIRIQLIILKINVHNFCLKSNFKQVQI